MIFPVIYMSYVHKLPRKPFKRNTASATRQGATEGTGRLFDDYTCPPKKNNSHKLGDEAIVTNFPRPNVTCPDTDLLVIKLLIQNSKTLYLGSILRSFQFQHLTLVITRPTRK